MQRAMPSLCTILVLSMLGMGCSDRSPSYYGPPITIVEGNVISVITPPHKKPPEWSDVEEWFTSADEATTWTKKTWVREPDGSLRFVGSREFH